MLWLLALLGSLHGGLVAFNEKNSQFNSSVSHIPEALRIDERQKSFQGQDYTEVRLPYGGNPNFAKTVADGTLIDTHQYREAYQMNIKNVQVLTEDYRLDNQFFTPANNYHNYHMPEATFSKIDEYWRNRRAQRSQ
jgi:hypothetical protein